MVPVNEPSGSPISFDKPLFPKMVQGGESRRKYMWMKHDFSGKKGGRTQATIKAVEASLKEGLSMEELESHEEHLKALKTKVLTHIKEKRWFKNTRIKNVSRMFDQALLQVSEQKQEKWRTLRLPPDQNSIEWACSTFTRATVNSKDEFGKTPLHYAAQKGSLETVNALLGKGADLSIQDNEGNTPLHSALTSGMSPVCQLLIGKAVSHVFTMKNKNGEIPFFVAVKANKTELCSSILDKTQNQDSSLWVDNKRNSVWHILAENTLSRQRHTIQELLDVFSKMPEEVKKTAWSLKNSEGKTPVEVAASSESFAMMSVLFAPFEKRIDCGLDIGPVVQILVDLFEKEGVYPRERGDRIGSMIYSIVATHPELIKVTDKEGKSPYDRAMEIVKGGKTIPDEILYCLKNPDEAHDLIRSEELEAEKIMTSRKEEIGKKTTQEGLQHYQEEVTDRFAKQPKLSAGEIREQADAPSNEKGDNYWHTLASEVKKFEDIYDWICPEAKKKLQEKNREKLTPIHVAIRSKNLAFIEALCSPVRRCPLDIDWKFLGFIEVDWKSLKSFEYNLLEFAINEYKECSTQEEKKASADIVKLLASVYPPFVQEIKDPDTLPKEIADIIKNLGKIRLEEMIQKSKIDYLDREGKRLINDALASLKKQ